MSFTQGLRKRVSESFMQSCMKTSFMKRDPDAKFVSGARPDFRLINSSGYAQMHMHREGISVSQITRVVPRIERSSGTSAIVRIRPSHRLQSIPGYRTRLNQTLGSTVNTHQPHRCRHCCHSAEQTAGHVEQPSVGPILRRRAIFRSSHSADMVRSMIV